MGVQTKILKRTEEYEIKLADGSTKKVQYGTAALIGGTPGQIYDVAYGPVVHTTTLAEAADIGSFVDGQGIIVNAPEYALYGVQSKPLEPTLLLPQGTVVSCMTAGHVWMTKEAFDAIGEKANVCIIWQQAGAAGKDLVVVEINGLASYGPGSDSTANG